MQLNTLSPNRNIRRPVSRRSLRHAFSLIELMVVIVIIAILMALILSGVRGAMGTVRNATVTVEFKNLEKGILDFKTKFGIEPPSSVTLYEDGTDWTTSAPPLAAAIAARSRSLVRQMWPDFSFSIDRDINGDGDQADTITLNGAECLVFFLGGVNGTNIVDKSGTVIGTPGNAVTAWTPLGFSASPVNPFARGGARSGPFYEFDNARVVNRDAASASDPEGFPEYIDSLPGQRNPILYASSYGGKGYRDVDVQLSPPATVYNEYATVPTRFSFVYRRYSESDYPSSPTPAYPAPAAKFTAAEAFNPKTSQLISPGADGEYGWGGVLSTNMELLEPRPERYFERDNITNFKGGVLN